MTKDFLAEIPTLLARPFHHIQTRRPTRQRQRHCLIYIRTLLVVAIGVFTAAIPAYAKSIAEPLAQQAKMKPSKHDAEVLWSISETRVLENGTQETTHYHSIRLNEKKATRDYGRIAISFNHFYNDLEVDFANVLSKDGQLNSVAKDAMQLRVTGGGQDFYSDQSEYVFSLPNIQVGSIIEFQFSIKSKERPLPSLINRRASPHWAQPTNSNDNVRLDFVRNHRFTLSYPSTMTWYHHHFGGYPKKHKVKREGDFTTLTWQLKNVDEIKVEPGMPSLYTSHVKPLLVLSSQNSWHDVAAWTKSLFYPQYSNSAKIKSIVAGMQLPANATTEDKAKAVYQYLQENIRYVFAHLNRGGYTPHAADEVIKAEYGDCKDQTVLAISLLQALGVKAYPALLETQDSSVNETDIIDLSFDHVLVYMPATATSDAIWMDTTGDRNLYPGMSSSLDGEIALIVDGQGYLEQIPYTLNNNELKVVLDYKTKDAETAVVEAKIFSSGFYDQMLRSLWLNSSRRDEAIDNSLKAIFNNNQDMELEKKVLHGDNLWRPIEIHATYTLPNTSAENGSFAYAASFAQIYGEFGFFSHLHSPENRVHPFENAVPRRLVLEVNFHGKPGMYPVVIESSGNIQSPHAKLIQTGKASDVGYSITATLEIDRHIHSVKEYKTLHDTLASVTQPGRWLVSFKHGEQDSETALADLKEKSGENSSSYQLELAKNQIDQGLFGDALSSSEKAVKFDKSNGEAWYYLGMAQGLNSMLDESTKSFEKAAALGYLP